MLHAAAQVTPNIVAYVLTHHSSCYRCTDAADTSPFCHIVGVGGRPAPTHTFPLRALNYEFSFVSFNNLT